MEVSGMVFFWGILGLLASIPLIWLSWHIPQRLLAAWGISEQGVCVDPAIRCLGWQDALLVLLLVCVGMGAATRWGGGMVSLMGLCFGATLLLLALIDTRTRLLPDVLTLPLLWAGLVWHASGFGLQTSFLGGLSLEQAVWGAVTGYIALWLPCVLLQYGLGREMMGHGDFKLSAALGAWLGCAALPYVGLIASSASLLFAVLAHRFVRRKLRHPMPFGPGLALGGILMLFFDGLS